MQPFNILSNLRLQDVSRPAFRQEVLVREGASHARALRREEIEAAERVDLHLGEGEKGEVDDWCRWC